MLPKPTAQYGSASAANNCQEFSQPPCSARVHCRNEQDIHGYSASIELLLLSVEASRIALAHNSPASSKADRDKMRM